MEFIILIINIIESIVFVYLAFAAVYILVYAIAGKIGYKPKLKPASVTRKIAVLIPGYKEDSVIVEVAKDALKQDYPKEKFDVVIIADSFKTETIDELKLLPIILVEVSFEKSTKSKALNKAMATISDSYEIAVVLDADNLMAKNFLKMINQSFENGFKTVQGHRVAKNMNTNFAVLDAISEEINNHIYRLGHRAIGLSSALIGSGMAFDYAFFKNIMSRVDAVGGFDKELELRLLQNREKIEYLNDAIVLDEKVQKAEVFANQRKRWLSAQFVYFGRYFLPGLKDLFTKGNIDFMDKVYQMVQPPRIILIGLTFLIAAVWTLVFIFKIESIQNLFLLGLLEWGITFLLVLMAFVLSIPSKFYNKQTIKALWTLPKGFFMMFASLFKLKGANKKFIHTQHGT